MSREDQSAFRATVLHLERVARGEEAWRNPLVINELRQGAPIDDKKGYVSVPSYVPNPIEEAFAKGFRRRQLITQATGSFTGVTLMWMYCVRRMGGVHMLREDLQRSGVLRHPVFWASFTSGVIGSVAFQMFRITGEVKKAMMLQGSPLAAEGRYALWDEKQDHWLLKDAGIRFTSQDWESALDDGNLDDREASVGLSAAKHTAGVGLDRLDVDIAAELASDLHGGNDFLLSPPATPEELAQRRERFYSNRSPTGDRRKFDAFEGPSKDQFDIEDMFEKPKLESRPRKSGGM